jgi:PAS domain S-box-containing protein
MQNQNTTEVPIKADPCPQPRLRALQVEDLYRYAGPAAAFSYIGALLTLGVLIEIDDPVRGSVWFVYATMVAVLRFSSLIAFKRRQPGSDAAYWARLVILTNLLAGIQWGILGGVLFPSQPTWAQLYVVMVVIAFVGGSLTAYAAVRGAHEALSVPATIPTAINLFFVQDGTHWIAGITALLFSAAIVYYARKENRHLVQSFRLQLERDDLLRLTGLLNEKLQKENRELAHRAAVRGMSIEHARERAGRLEALFENSLLPQIECDGAGNVVTCNRAAQRVLGVSHGEIAGRPFAYYLAGPYAASKAIAGAQAPVNVELEIRGRDGQPHACSASFTPLPAIEGIRPGFAVILSGLDVPAEVK